MDVLYEHRLIRLRHLKKKKEKIICIFFFITEIMYDNEESDLGLELSHFYLFFFFFYLIWNAKVNLSLDVFIKPPTFNKFLSSLIGRNWSKVLSFESIFFPSSSQSLSFYYVNCGHWIIKQNNYCYKSHL